MERVVLPGAEAAYICDFHPDDGRQPVFELQIDKPGGNRVVLGGMFPPNHNFPREAWPATDEEKAFLRSVFMTAEIVTEFGELTQLVESGPLRLRLPEDVLWEDVQWSIAHFSDFVHFATEGPIGTEPIATHETFRSGSDSPFCEPFYVPGAAEAYYCDEGMKFLRILTPDGEGWTVSAYGWINEEFVHAVFATVTVTPNGSP
ncbi:MAG: hypothetical protein FWD83_05970 [Promicromonosporaceae bacterium]|nr:hypothetical protein [Promicromonosporaceae bacterium]